MSLKCNHFSDTGDRQCNSPAIDAEQRVIRFIERGKKHSTLLLFGQTLQDVRVYSLHRHTRPYAIIRTGHCITYGTALMSTRIGLQAS